MKTFLVVCMLVSTAYLASGYTVGQSCSSSSQCNDDNSMCKSMAGCRGSMKCVCKFGYVWNGDLTNGNGNGNNGNGASTGNCLHRNFLKTGLACRVDLDCAGSVTMDPLDYTTTTWALGHKCINNKCACQTNYEPISSTNPFGWVLHTCMLTTTTSTTTSTTTPTTTTSTTSTTTTSTSTSSTTSTTTTTPTTTTTTTPTTTTTTSTTTTTLPLKQWGQKCYDNTNGYTTPGCDTTKNLRCQPSETCAPDVTTFYCYCANGWTQDQSGGCKKVQLGDMCNVTSHCTYLGSLAYCNDDGVCDVAKPNASAPVGVMCDKTSAAACMDTNSICKPHDACEMYDMCICKWGYVYNGHKCLPTSALKVGAACTTHWDCMYQARRDPRDFSMIWLDKVLFHMCSSGKCSCDSSYDPIQYKMYDIGGASTGNFSLAYDLCTYRTTTTSTSSTSTTTSTTSTTSTSTSTSTTTSTTTTPTTTTTTTTPTTTTTTATTTTTPACPSGYVRRGNDICRKYLNWGDQCMDVTWTSGNNQGYFDATIVCDPLKTLVCSDPDQCSMAGNNMRSCSCKVGYKQDGTGCKKIEVGDACNTTLYCNTYFNGGYCGDNGKCTTVFISANSGFAVKAWSSPLLVLLVLLVCLFK